MLRSETAASPERRQAALAGLRAYQQAVRTAEHVPPPAFATAGRATLRDYGGRGRTVVFVPSLINPPFVLDLAPGNSLLRWLAEQGQVRPLLVDWGTPGPEHAGEDIDAHITRLLIPLLDALDEPPVLAGYCLGGTIATAAACLRPVAGLALIAAPWHFRRYGETALAGIAAQWEAARPSCATMGLVPVEVLQAGFWQLDPTRTIAKYERFAALDPASSAFQAFVALEDWANGGAPLTYGAGKQMFDHFFTADRPGAGRWWIDGTRIAPRKIAAPIIEFISATDRIVPAASAAGIGDHRTLGAGHVGMVVGGKARPQLWQPLADWISALPVPR